MGRARMTKGDTRLRTLGLKAWSRILTICNGYRAASIVYLGQGIGFKFKCGQHGFSFFLPSLTKGGIKTSLLSRKYKVYTYLILISASDNP